MYPERPARYLPSRKVTTGGLAHGKEAKLSFRRVPDVPESSAFGRRSEVTLNQDLKKMNGFIVKKTNSCRAR